MSFKNLPGWLTLFVLASFGLSFCTKSTEIGLDLLEEDLADLAFVDTFSVQTATEVSKPIVTYNPYTFLNVYLAGRMDDPIFGKTEASVYSQVIPEFLRPNFPGNFKFDSIVLVLPYDTARFYGDLTRPVEFEVYRVAQNMPAGTTNYSNTVFETFPEVLGRASAIPKKDSVFVLDYAQGTASTIGFPHLRIPLDERLGTELLRADTLVYTSDSLFTNYFKGIYLQPTANTKSSVGFNLASSRSGIVVYYSVDTLKRQFRFEFNPFVTKSVNFKHNYVGKTVEPYLDQSPPDRNLAFAQGMAGVNARLTIPNIRNLKNVIINKAELELRVATLPDDSPAFFPPSPNLVLYYIDKDGAIQIIPDVLLAEDKLSLNFGGSYTAGTGGEPGIYKMNLTAHLQDMVDGVVGKDILVALYPKAERNSRVVFYGSGNAQYKPKLRIAYTQLNN